MAYTRDFDSNKAARVRQREQEFERAYLESYPVVYNYVRYRMNGADATEDVVAEAFMLAAKSFDRFDPRRSKFSTWVTSIAINCMKSYYRKARPTASIDDVSESTMAVEGCQDEVDDCAFVDQLLGVLDDTEREIVVMKYREGLRNVDIAHALNMNASTVSTKVASALAKMRVVAQKR